MPWFSSQFSLQAPTVFCVEVLTTLWRVETPQGFKVSQSGGNVQSVLESVEYARKVDTILSQIKRVQRVAKTDRSSGRRSRAVSNLQQLEQALSDNVSDLEQALDRSWRRTRWAERTRPTASESIG